MFLEQLLTIAAQWQLRQDLVGQQAGYIVRSALWTSWQQVKMLYLFAIVNKGVHLGFRLFDAVEIVSREFHGELHITINDMSKTYTLEDRSTYICNWAFELLTKEQCCIGGDFRRFHERFNSLCHNAAVCMVGG